MSDQFFGLASPPPDAFDGDEAQKDYWNSFARTRSIIMRHQASWPIVAVDHDALDYLRSETGARVASAEFIAWLRGL